MLSNKKMKDKEFFFKSKKNKKKEKWYIGGTHNIIISFVKTYPTIYYFIAIEKDKIVSF